MKHLLSFLNVSNPDKLGCDSGVIFHRLILGEAAVHDWRATIASPVDIQVDGARHSLFDPGSSKYEVRYRFDWQTVANILKREQPDVVLVNQIELVENIKALLITEDINCRIATYCHYWPVMQFRADGGVEWDPSLDHSGLAEGILLKVLRAFQISDVFMVTSDYARGLLGAALERYHLAAPDRQPIVVNCPADPIFLPEEPEFNWSSRRILYNSRLYEQYGTAFLIKLLGATSSKGFEFVVTDFLENRNAARTRLDPTVSFYRRELERLPNVELVSNGDIRATYRNEIVSGSFLCLAPHRRNANWSMGALDCMGLGIPAIARKMASFPEFVPEPLLYDDLADAVDLIDRLRSDRALYERLSRIVHRRAKDFAASIIARRFFDALRGAIR